MNESDGAVSARLKETAGSLRDLWVYIALAASTVSLFGNAALQVTLFEVFMGIYRTPTYAVYNALDWPSHFGLPSEKLVRDITTVVLATLAFTIAKLHREYRAYADLKMALRENEKATLSALREPDGGVQASRVVNGTMLGLLLGGPLVAVLGAAAGAASNFFEHQESKAEKQAALDRANATAQSALLAGRKALLWQPLNRMAFCLFVGAAILILDANADRLIEFLSTVDAGLQSKMEELADLLNAA